MSIQKYLEAGNERPNKRPERFPSGESAPEPTEKDYERGFYERFFVRKRGTAQITEVSETEYKKFTGSKYFVRFSLKWKISGPRSDVFNDAGYPVETGVEDTNLRVLDQTDERGISDKLSDPLEYWDGNN
jgi:hypothetical protein